MAPLEEGKVGIPVGGYDLSLLEPTRISVDIRYLLLDYMSSSVDPTKSCVLIDSSEVAEPKWYIRRLTRQPFTELTDAPLETVDWGIELRHVCGRREVRPTLCAIEPESHEGDREVNMCRWKGDVGQRG
jgi:hypothetical protein